MKDRLPFNLREEGGLESERPFRLSQGKDGEAR